MKRDGASKLTKQTKWALALGTAFVLYTIIGFFVVPAVVKSQMLKRLPVLTQRQVAIDRVRFNPYVLSLTIDGFSLKETNGEVFSSFGELYVNFQLSSIFRRAFVFKEISLRDPFAQITYFTNGMFNFSNLLTNAAPAPAPAPQKPQALPRVIVYDLLVTNGAVAFADMTRKTPFHIRYQPINVDLTDLSTLPDRTSPYGIHVTSDSGETFRWTGDITVNPLRSSGTFQLGGLDLKKYMPYSQDYARFKIAGGKMDATADYRYDSATNALDLTVSNASLALTSFQLKSPDTGEDVVTIPLFSVGQIRASVAQHTAEVGRIASGGGSLLVRRNHDGTINLLDALVPQPKAAPASLAPPAADPSWTARIDEIAIDNYAVKIEDKTPDQPASFNLSRIGLDLKNVSNASNVPVAVALSLRLQETGQITVNGAATLLPPSADLRVGVTNLDLRIAQPYLQQQVNMAIARGALNIAGRARYRPGAPVVGFDGDVSVRNFAVTDEVLFEDMTGWDGLEVTGIQAEFAPLKIHIDKIKVSGPKSSVIVGPDGRPNVLTVLPKKTAVPAETNAAPSPAAPLPDLSVGEFAFENASFHFADRSLEPNCVFDVQESSGSLRGVSSRLETPTPLEVKGKIDQFSSFGIAGKVNPMPDNLFLDTTVALTNMGLTAFSPYTEKYVGRPLEKGKLSLALNYYVNHKDLNASNFIFVDQLTLGAKNGSTNATKLPVKLAIALLKDRNGRIKLDIPVQGQLDNPKFKLGPIIWGVVENLLVKAATAPFALLGSMFGGGAELSYVAFDPGQADISPAETNKLATLTKALYERPGLTLEINGSADPAKDREVLARVKFERQLRADYIKELIAAGKPPVDESAVTLAPADHDRLVFRAYTNAFGAGTNQIATGPTQATPARVVIKNLPPTPKAPTTHGATALMAAESGTTTGAMTASPQNPSVPGQAPGGPLDAAAMEEQLLQKVDVTNDDFRQLMEDRAKHVEVYLLKSGQVTADRLFITAPKPVAAGQGEARVNLTLD